MTKESIILRTPTGGTSEISARNTDSGMVELTITRAGASSVSRFTPDLALDVSILLHDAAMRCQKVPTPQQQIEQGRACGCSGADDMCPCQNVVPIR